MLWGGTEWAGSARAGHTMPPQLAHGACTINTVLINYGEKLLLAREPRLPVYKVNALMLSFKEHFHQLKPAERSCDI